MLWTDDNTRESPTSYDMDGEGTSLRVGDIVILHEHYLPISGYDVVRSEDYQIIIAPEANFEVVLSFIDENYLNMGSSWKYESTGPPPINSLPKLDRVKHARALEIIRNSGLNLRQFYSLEGGVAKTWSAAANSSWSVAASWGGVVPGNNDAVNFTGASTKNCDVDFTPFTYLSFNVTAGYTGTITMNSSIIFNSNVTIAFGGSGGFAGNASITMIGTANLSSNKSIPNLVINVGSVIIQTAAVTSASLTISGTLDTNVISHYNLNTTTLLDIGGTLYCRASNCSFTGQGATAGYSVFVHDSGEFFGGSGAHTIGSFATLNNNANFTTGNTTINNVRSGDNVSLGIQASYTFNASTGTVIFTRAGAQQLVGDSGTAQTFYNLTIDILLKIIDTHGNPKIPIFIYRYVDEQELKNILATGIIKAGGLGINKGVSFTSDPHGMIDQMQMRHTRRPYLIQLRLSDFDNYFYPVYYANPHMDKREYYEIFSAYGRLVDVTYLDPAQISGDGFIQHEYFKSESEWRTWDDLYVGDNFIVLTKKI